MLIGVMEDEEAAKEDVFIEEVEDITELSGWYHKP